MSVGDGEVEVMLADKWIGFTKGRGFLNTKVVSGLFSPKTRGYL